MQQFLISCPLEKHEILLKDIVLTILTGKAIHQCFAWVWQASRYQSFFSEFRIEESEHEYHTKAKRILSARPHCIKESKRYFICFKLIFGFPHRCFTKARVPATSYTFNKCFCSKLSPVCLNFLGSLRQINFIVVIGLSDFHSLFHL